MASLKSVWKAAGKLSEPSDSEKALEERVKYLVRALQNSCKEKEFLQRELECAKEKFEACRKAFEKLLEELHEEGATLKAKDKDRFRKSLRDLKDYEMYKNVMEATMMRMKSELTSLMEENLKLRDSNTELRSICAKQKNIDCKMSKNVIDFRKRVKDLEAKNTTLIQEKTRVQRDRDIAVAGLVKFTTELSSNRFGNNY